MRTNLFTILIYVLLPLTINGQTKKISFSSKHSKGITQKNKSLLILWKKVVFKHHNSIMNCDSASYDRANNSFIAYSNIKIVELPGIENQKGLGIKYMKHIRSAKLFCFIIDSNSAVNDYVMSIIDNFSDFETKSLLEKSIVVLTKSDKLSDGEKKSTCDSLKKIFNVPVFYTDNSDQKHIIEYVYSNKNNEKNPVTFNKY